MTGIPSDKKSPTDILSFWHAIEFFLPYSLDSVMENQQNACARIEGKEITKKDAKPPPWLVPKKTATPNSTEYRYNLYILPFEQKLLTQLCHRLSIPTDAKSRLNQLSFKEDTAHEGLTCFARIALSADGTLTDRAISVSALPWAMGKLQASQYAKITADSHTSDMEQLLLSLNAFIASEKPLQWADIDKILAIFIKWAGFDPERDDDFKLLLERTEKRISTKKEEPEKKKTKETSSKKASTAFKKLKKGEDDEDDASLDILNSFYIRDLEKVINDLRINPNSSSTRLVTQYLMGLNPDERTDVYHTKGDQYLRKQIEPAKNNIGSWPSNPKTIMSLMQQVAINKMSDRTLDSCLFSVNGPPGTGKSTLFKDLIADNIVQRASLLSRFNGATETFLDDGEQTQHDFSGSSGYVAKLRGELTGFEMLVVSSNNAAVENISKELPDAQQIDAHYKDRAAYLKPVVTKLFAEHKKEQKKDPFTGETFERIAPQTYQHTEHPWGLISIALGRYQKRSSFINRFFFSELDDESIKNAEPYPMLSIGQWRARHKHLSFRQAKIDFLAAKTAVDTHVSMLDSLARQQKTIAAYPEYAQKTHRAFEKAQESTTQAKKHFKTIQEKYYQHRHHGERSHKLYEDNLQLKPLFFYRWLNTKNARIFYENDQKLKNQLYLDRIKSEKLESSMALAKERLERDSVHLKQLEQQIQESKQQHSEEVETYEKLIKQYKITPPPLNQHLLEQSDTQQQASWHHPKLNELRAELFIQALKLHEAWLSDALENARFHSVLISISKMLKGDGFKKKELDIHLWQNLFMVIPVISSTFASVERQFKNMPAASLGYVLIDEAGQATPQSAIGAMWRAKKTLVVGDPMQVNPIFTIPPKLVNFIAKQHLGQGFDPWVPWLSSVQTLADQANPIGTYMTQSDESKQWVGCPLRIHYRCIDPMFSTANIIAYNQQMINARPALPPCSAETFLLGDTGWYDIGGIVSNKHYVTEQGDFLCKIISHLYHYQASAIGDIYIISPFRKIKESLINLLQSPNNWMKLDDPVSDQPTKSHIKQWCREHIGTVHTFQGKQNQLVIFILGGDASTTGAINWASSRPNILNVALTRAKNRFYIIGDHGLWSNKPFFRELAPHMPIKSQEVMTRCERDKNMEMV